MMNSKYTVLQTLLCMACAVLIMVEVGAKPTYINTTESNIAFNTTESNIAFSATESNISFNTTATTTNSLPTFTCPHQYSAELGISRLAMVRTVDRESGQQVLRSSFWLFGSDEDSYTIFDIKSIACYEGVIPTIVLSMHPTQGLTLNSEARHYRTDQYVDTWEEYDELVWKYAKELQDVPSIIVMEPSLLMYTFDVNGLQYHRNSENIDYYHHPDYQIRLIQRVQIVVNLFTSSWVYVDAGNAMYLQWQVNLEHIISVMKQMPPAIRGFSINVGSFVNNTFNEQLAGEIHCHTGLHFIIDSSRNGGEFSYRSIDEMAECLYDPPHIYIGVPSTFLPAASTRILRKRNAENDISAENNAKSGKTKRWVLSPSTEEPDIGNSTQTEDIPTLYPYDYNYYYGDYNGDECVTSEESGLDAYVWIKTPGESDGRMFPRGTYNACLLNNNIECTDLCPQYVPKIAGEFRIIDPCSCRN